MLSDTRRERGVARRQFTQEHYELCIENRLQSAGVNLLYGIRNLGRGVLDGT
jgi:hypothetical protein